MLGQPRNAYWEHWQSAGLSLSQPVGCKAAAVPKETPWSDSWISFSSHVFVCQSKQMQESHPALAHAVCAQSLSSNLVAAGAFLGICTF